MSVADLGLVNDYISFSHALAMLLHHSKEESESALSAFFDIILKPRKGKYIFIYRDQAAILDFRRMKLSIDAAKVASMVLKSGKPVIALDLDNYKHVKILCAGLRINRTLKVLNWSTIRLTDMGMKSISQALRANKTLELLKLNIIRTIEDRRAIFEAIRTNRMLIILDISSSRIGNEGAIILGEGLKTNKTLTHLSIEINGIELEAIKAICKGLKANKVLSYLNFGYGLINLEDAKTIGEAIKANKTLKVYIYTIFVLEMKI